MNRYVLIVALLISGFLVHPLTGICSNVHVPNQDQSNIYFHLAKNLTAGKDYIPNTVIFKIKTAYRSNCKTNSIDGIMSLQDYLQSVGVKKLTKIFPYHTPPSAERNNLEQPLADLSLIYSLNYSGDKSLEEVINKLRSFVYVAYAEPSYIPKFQSFVPNDNNKQYHLQGNVAGSLNSEDAWDLTQGDSTVVIGIVDSGTDTAHPDLAGNYLGGFDVGMNDPDPSWELTSHGVEVAGTAAAVTNNVLAPYKSDTV